MRKFKVGDILISNRIRDYTATGLSWDVEYCVLDLKPYPNSSGYVVLIKNDRDIVTSYDPDWLVSKTELTFNKDLKDILK